MIKPLRMEAVQTSEMLVNSYQSTWRYNPEDSHLQDNIFLKWSLTITSIQFMIIPTKQ
jgi:hypothetical protein